jgi:hypothetical protein
LGAALLVEIVAPELPRIATTHTGIDTVINNACYFTSYHSTTTITLITSLSSQPKVKGAFMRQTNPKSFSADPWYNENMDCIWQTLFNQRLQPKIFLFRTRFIAVGQRHHSWYDLYALRNILSKEKAWRF